MIKFNLVVTFIVRLSAVGNSLGTVLVPQGNFVYTPRDLPLWSSVTKWNWKAPGLSPKCIEIPQIIYSKMSGGDIAKLPSAGSCIPKPYGREGRKQMGRQG